MRKAIISLLLVTTFCGLRAQNYRINLENEAVSRYLSEVTYTSADDVSRVADYTQLVSTRTDQPQVPMIKISSVFLNVARPGDISVRYSTDAALPASSTDTVVVMSPQVYLPLYGLLPGQTYYYSVDMKGKTLSKGTIVTDGQVRMLYLPSMFNVRDIGGWPTVDGRRIKYNKIIRGSEMNGLHVADSADLMMMRQLGIAAELDLRAWYEEECGVSALGFTGTIDEDGDNVPTYLYTNDSGQLLEHMTKYMFLIRWRSEFQFIVMNLKQGRTVYQHCRWGADRTGYLSLLLEGLLGVGYDGLVKDYELTSFCNEMNKNKESIDPVIDYIESLDGETLQQKFYTFWLRRVGVTRADIDFFINDMLEGEPQDDVTTGIAHCTVSQPSANQCFDLQGRRIGQQHHGLFIERSADGSIRKRMATR